MIYGNETHVGIIVATLVAVGIGVGCTIQPTIVALQAHTTKARRSVIISCRNFNRCAGGACGLAISAALMQARLRATLPPHYAYLASSTYALPDVDGGIPSEVMDAYMAASHTMFLLQVPLVGLCLLASFLVRDEGLTPKEERLQTNAPVPGRGITSNEPCAEEKGSKV